MDKIQLIPLGIIVLYLLISVFIIMKDNYDLDKDLIKLMGDSIIKNGNEIEIIEALMNYTHIHGTGVCTDKSFLFERLLKSKGIKNRHIVCKGFVGGHGTTQVFVNNEWVFYDSFYSRTMTLADYKELGYDKCFTHVNCVNKRCTNFRMTSYRYNVFMSKDLT